MKAITLVLATIVALTLVSELFAASNKLAPRSRAQCREMATARGLHGGDVKNMNTRSRFIKRCMEGKGLKKFK